MSHWECALPLSEMRLGRAHPSEKKREIHSSCQMHSTFQIEKGSIQISSLQFLVSENTTASNKHTNWKTPFHMACK